jgi:hypothetical protein
MLQMQSVPNTLRICKKAKEKKPQSTTIKSALTWATAQGALLERLVPADYNVLLGLFRSCTNASARKADLNI